MASVGLGFGLGVSGLMKREVAGPVRFRMSGMRRIRVERGDTVEEGMLADCSHCSCHYCRACVVKVMGLDLTNLAK